MVVHHDEPRVGSNASPMQNLLQKLPVLLDVQLDQGLLARVPS